MSRTTTAHGGAPLRPVARGRVLHGLVVRGGVLHGPAAVAR
ncbi:hypothetical protein [Streptosporangium sp. NPDC003464]